MQTACRMHPTASRLQHSQFHAVPRPCSIHTTQKKTSVRHWQQRQDRHVQHSRTLQLVQAERTTTSSSSSSGNGTPNGSIITDSDISFLGKLLVFSFAGAALIKYGSLAIELPFQPNAAVALALVLGTPAAYSLYLLTKGSDQQQ